MVLGKLPVPGRPTILITVGQGPIALAVGAGGGGLDIFTLIYPSFPLSPSLWETARYRLIYCLKGPLNPKPTNQPNPPVEYLYICFNISCSYTEEICKTFHQWIILTYKIFRNRNIFNTALLLYRKIV